MANNDGNWDGSSTRNGYYSFHHHQIVFRFKCIVRSWIWFSVDFLARFRSYHFVEDFAPKNTVTKIQTSVTAWHNGNGTLGITIDPPLKVTRTFGVAKGATRPHVHWIVISLILNQLSEMGNLTTKSEWNSRNHGRPKYDACTRISNPHFHYNK